MSVLSEGQLSFTFSQECIATQYDNWSFYRNQFVKTCGSVKAVDMICIHKDVTWLIEIKDYRRNKRTKPIDLADEIALKVRDTLAGLVAAKFNANDISEQQFAQKALEANIIRVVLHLEQVIKPSRLFPVSVNPISVMQKLKKQLKAIDAHSVIVDQNNLKPDMAWTVQG